MGKWHACLLLNNNRLSGDTRRAPTITKIMMLKLLKYLTHSGATISIPINPLHWYYIPRFYKQVDPWDDYTFIVSFLFLHINFYISDGSW
jgi:hypothetical protein